MKLISTLALVLLLAACNNGDSEGKASSASGDTSEVKTDVAVSLLTDQEIKEGWVSLFDGKTLSGWHKYGGEPAGSAWKVVDGAIYLDTSAKKGWQTVNGGDIVTDSSFENYDLKLQWKISPAGNSGVIFNVHEDTVKFKHSFESGPEMQVVDNEGHPDGKLVKHQAGDLYDLIASSQKSARPVGEWNDVEIRADHGQLDLFLNGVQVVSTKMWTEDWKKLVAGSKFKEWPGFGTFTRGGICLQDHGNAVWYRNIRIRKL